MDADVAVIGTGTMGAMTAWRLAEAGLSTIAFERFGIGHDRSAAGGESRIFRTAYLEGPEYVPLLRRSQELWRDLERDTGQALLDLTGALMIGVDGSPHMGNVLESVRRFDLPHEVLDRAAMASRYPQHVLADGEFAVFDPNAGVLRPEFAVIGAARRAAERGARLVPHTAVQEVAPDTDGVTVRTPDRTYRVRHVVVAAGPWTARLLPQYAGRVDVRRIVMTWFRAGDPAAYAPDRFPIFIREDTGYDVFGIPTLDGGSVKIALTDNYGAVGEPEQLDHDVPPADLETVSHAAATYLADLHDYPHRVSVHMDGYTPDRHPIVGPVPGHPNITVLGGFSGHGFKMSPAIAEAAVDLITKGETTLPITHLNPSRFA